MAYTNTFGGAAKDAANDTANAADLDTQFDAIETDLAAKANKTKVEATGDTSSGDNAAMGYTATEGLVLTGQGSTNDVTIKNDVDGDVLVIPTGTTTVDCKGAFSAAGAATLSDTVGVTGLLTATAGVTSGSNIVSDTDSTDDLGTTSVRWRELYVDDITTTNQSQIEQYVYTVSSTESQGATTMPLDDTIPQITEGVELLTQTITPKSTDNFLRVEANLLVGTDANVQVLAALFNTDLHATNAQFVTSAAIYTSNEEMKSVTIDFWVQAPVTSAMTFSVRAGCVSTGNVFINRSGAGAKFGATVSSTISITEYTP